MALTGQCRCFAPFDWKCMKKLKEEELFDNIKVTKKENECGHEIWTNEYPFKLIGHSTESNLALVWCDQCERSFWIQFEMDI